LYAKKATAGQSAFNVAVADFFNAPNIQEIDISAYTGQVGSLIRVRATDDFNVADVFVHITNADGSLVEEGAALLQSNGVDWVYTATKQNDSFAGDKITVTVTDIPRNTTVEEKAM
jgi:hypothetical protein